MAEALRLQVKGVEDLEVLSTLLQDAIIPGEDMTFERADHRFIMVANRFCWDQPAEKGLVGADGEPVYQRQLCGLQFLGVTRIQTSGLPTDRKTALLNLLAMTAPDAGMIDLAFSGGAKIRLLVDSLNVVAEDMGLAQPTILHPSHRLDGTP